MIPWNSIYGVVFKLACRLTSTYKKYHSADKIVARSSCIHNVLKLYVSHPTGVLYVVNLHCRFGEDFAICFTGSFKMTTYYTNNDISVSMYQNALELSLKANHLNIIDRLWKSVYHTVPLLQYCTTYPNFFLSAPLSSVGNIQCYYSNIG